jgi:hypothetical protein
VWTSVPILLCVFITAEPITKLFARGEGDSGGHRACLLLSDYCSTYFAVVTFFVCVVEMAMFVADPTECLADDGVAMMCVCVFIASIDRCMFESVDR